MTQGRPDEFGVGLAAIALDLSNGALPQVCTTDGSPMAMTAAFTLP